MAKQKQERRLPAAEAMCKVRTLRTSPRKLNLVAQSIRGLNVQRALNELEFSHKRIAQDVRTRCTRRSRTPRTTTTSTSTPWSSPRPMWART
jgi:ribosomal protein L22